uniref:Transposase n=1 Tax=Meloidogyne hapla TaxID=6305 RepID=A0A1I8B7I7_MELHA
MDIYSNPQTEEAAIQFLQSKNILPTNKICANRHEMKLSIGNQVRWQCGKSKCRSEVKMRAGNWLEGSRIPFVTIVRFIYAWAFEMTSIKFCERRNKKHRGTARHHLESYLAEFMCRQEAKEEDFFEWICKKIAEFWPPK